MIYNVFHGFNLQPRIKKSSNKTYNRDHTMKTKEIIAAGLVTLALLAGCSKETESTSTTTKSVTTAVPDPAEEPITIKESTSTTTTDTKDK